MTSLYVASTAHDIHRNRGDWTASPLTHADEVPEFDWLHGAKPLYAGRFAPFFYGRLADADVIVGGGGLLTNLWLYRHRMEEITEAAARRRLVLWGAGLNAHHQDRMELPGYLERFGKVGIRDYLPGSEYNWVPCVSCMLPELNQAYEIEHEAVVYDNWQFPCRIPGLPRMSNTCRLGDQRQSLRKAIAFLGSASTVITSSYHGAMWAILLGRRAIVARAFSSKFNTMRYPPVILANLGQDWRPAQADAVLYPNALAESRQVTVIFAREARAFLGR